MKKIIMAVLTLSLSSCGIYNSYQPKTEADVRTDLYGAMDGGSSAISTADTSFAALSWRELFIDPQLQALIDTCLRHNADIETARLHVDQANAGLSAARLSYLPSIAFAPNGVLTKYGLDGATTAKAYTLPLQAQWQIDAFGLLRNQHREKKAVRDMMLDVQQATTTALIGGVANTYYTLAMLDEQIRIARETSQNWSETVRTIRTLMQAGMANQAAVSQLEAAQHGVDVQLLSLEQSRNEVCNALSLLLNEPAGSRKDLHPQLGGFIMPETLGIGLPCRLLYARPDVRAAEANLRAACYANKAASSAFFPQLNLTGTFGWTNTTGSAIINPAFTITQLVGSLVQPIFAHGGLIAQKRAAKDELEIARIAFEHKLLEAGTEVCNHLDACLKARNKSRLFAEQVAALETASRATQLTMEHGTATYLDVLTARQSLLSAQLGQVANRFAEIQATIDLFTALGGDV